MAEESKWKPGMECVPDNMKEEDGKVYICNKRGRWVTHNKKKTIEGGISPYIPELVEITF